MKADRYLAPHYAYYVREIKVFISTLVIFFSVLFSFLSTSVKKLLLPLGESLCSAAWVLSVSHSSLHGRYIRHHITGVDVFGPHVICILLFPDAFGVTEAYMDQELCRFIASGRLHAKIDKVGLILTWMVLGDHLTSVNLNELWIIVWIVSY